MRVGILGLVGVLGLIDVLGLIGILGLVGISVLALDFRNFARTFLCRRTC